MLASMSEGRPDIRLDERALRLLRRRRRARVTLLVLLLAILAVVLTTRVRSGAASTDHDRYHQRRFEVVDAISGDLLRLGDGDGGVFEVRLIGVDANGSAAACQRLGALRGQQVMLYLEPVPTRNHAGELLALVYTDGEVLMNARLIEEGLAFADRRWDYSFTRQFFQLEEQAQARRRRIWADMTESQMPSWRQRWLAEMRKQPWEREDWRRLDEP